MRSNPGSTRWVFFMVSTGVFMSTMDSSMVNVALPTLMKTFNSSLALTEWVVLIYLLTITSLLLFWGKLCARLECGKIYSWGMLLFSIGSMLCGMAQSIWLLIFFRFIQALGASMMMATGAALIKLVFPPENLGKGLGMLGVATSLGLMSGPAVSGLILRWLHWRFIFWVTVPVGLFCYLAGRGKLAGCAAKGTGSANGKEHRIDVQGVLLWSIIVTLTLLLATYATFLCCGNGFFATILFAAGCISVFVGWVFLGWIEKRKKIPFLPVRLLQQRFFAMAILSSTLSFAVLFFVLILMPFYLDHVLRLPPDQIGYVMMSVPLCVFIVSPVAGRLFDSFGAKIVATGGLFFCFTGMALLTRLDAHTSPFTIVFLLALLGFGQAMFLSPNSASALGGVPDDQAGITASLLATARNFGMLGGTALAGLSFSLIFSRATGGLDMKEFTPAQIPAFMSALDGSFTVAMFIALLAIAASWLRGREVSPGNY